MVEKRAMIGWYFLNMPVDGDPDLSLMPTAEHRNQLRLAIKHLPATKPILLVDFYGDGALTGAASAPAAVTSTSTTRVMWSPASLFTSPLI